MNMQDKREQTTRTADPGKIPELAAAREDGRGLRVRRRPRRLGLGGDSGKVSGCQGGRCQG